MAIRYGIIQLFILYVSVSMHHLVHEGRVAEGALWWRKGRGMNVLECSCEASIVYDHLPINVITSHNPGEGLATLSRGCQVAPPQRRPRPPRRCSCFSMQGSYVILAPPHPSRFHSQPLLVPIPGKCCVVVTCLLSGVVCDG